MLLYMVFKVMEYNMKKFRESSGVEMCLEGIVGADVLVLYVCVWGGDGRKS